MSTFLEHYTRCTEPRLQVQSLSNLPLLHLECLSNLSSIAVPDVLSEILSAGLSPLPIPDSPALPTHPVFGLHDHSTQALVRGLDCLDHTFSIYRAADVGFSVLLFPHCAVPTVLFCSLQF